MILLQYSNSSIYSNALGSCAGIVHYIGNDWDRYITYLCIHSKLQRGVAKNMSKRLDEIKSELDHHLGKRLMLKANSGRRKTVEQSGVLAETYRSVFVVQLDQQEDTLQRVSYSYADVLTETVELTFYDDPHNEVILG